MDKIVRYLSKIAKHLEISFTWHHNEVEKKYYVRFYNPRLKKGIIRDIPEILLADDKFEPRHVCKQIVKDIANALID